MKVVLFCHSLLSDWNHGNVHFLRGVLSDLRTRGVRTIAYEPRDAWSARNLEADLGALPVAELARTYPLLGIASGGVVRYDPAALNVEQALDGADVVIVHEWNDPALVARLGRVRANGGRFVLLFHDTHAGSAVAARFGQRVEVADDEYEAARGADAVVLVTDWRQYASPDFDRLALLLRRPLVLDGRNLWSGPELRELGFLYEGIGVAA